MTSLIDKYVTLISGGHLEGKDYKGITDSPKDFQKAAALFLVSTIAGRNFLFMSAPETKLLGDDLVQGGKILNLWFIIMGKSRITRKTVSVSKIQEFVKGIDDRMLLPDDFTPQALIEILSKRNRGEQCCWMNDEISGFFEALQRADYMATADTVLSHIYDGRDYHRRTIKRASEVVEAPYLTCYLASTDYLPVLFDESKLRQGFLNRFIYVYAERTEWKPVRGRIERKEKQLAENIHEWLTELYEVNTRAVLDFSEEARQIYNDFEQDVEKEISGGMSPLKEGYMGNIPNFVVRLSGIFRIARLSTQELRDIQKIAILGVEEEDVMQAIQYSEKMWQWFEKSLELMHTPVTSREVVKDEHRASFVLSKIKASNKRSQITKNPQIDRTSLYRECNMPASELDEVIKLLTKSGRVKIHVDSSGGPGPNQRIYEYVDDDD